MTDSDLFERYRHLLGGRRSFEIGSGWLPLLADYLSVVDEELADPTLYRIIQIKEKMGHLVIYDERPPSAQITAARELAYARSFYRCETCGEPGVTRILHGWYSVRCEEHAHERGEYAPPQDPAPVVRIGTMEPRHWRRYDQELDVFVEDEPPEWAR